MTCGDFRFEDPGGRYLEEKGGYSASDTLEEGLAAAVGFRTGVADSSLVVRDVVKEDQADNSKTAEDFYSALV